MGAVENLQGWWNLGVNQFGSGQARQALGQTVANVGSMVSPGVVGSGSVTGLANTIAGSPVTGTYDVPWIQPKSNAQVLGATTSSGSGSTGGSGGGGGTSPFVQTYSEPGPSGPSYEDTQRAQINAGYDSYFNQLNDILNTNLPEQRGIQEGIVNEQYTSGANQLGTQRDIQTTNLATQQGTTLKDLGETVKNLFQAGNTYLGARGAGDSTAANMYSYALTKMGTKARGDVMSQVAQRKNQISDIYNSQLNQLNSEKNTQILNIANWFSQSQQSIKQMVAQGQLQKSTDLQNLSTQIYNQSLQAINQINQDNLNKRNTLMEWATTNAKSIGEVEKTLSSIGAYQPTYSMAGAIPTGAGQTQYQPVGYGGTEQKITGYDMFGKPIYQ